MPSQCGPATRQAMPWMYACKAGSRTRVPEVRSCDSVRSTCIQSPASLLFGAGRSAGLRSATRPGGGPAVAHATSSAGASRAMSTPRALDMSERNIAQQPLHHDQRVAGRLEASTAFLVDPDDVAGAEVHQRRDAHEPIAPQRSGRGEPSAGHAALDELDEQAVPGVSAVVAKDGGPRSQAPFEAAP